MTWFRVDDQFADHPKLVALRGRKGWHRALALWTLAGSWVGRHLNNGIVPAGIVGILGCSRADAEALVDVGLWERAEDGYLFHDWAAHNPMREDVERERAKTRDRVANWKAKKRVSNAAVTALPDRSEALLDDAGNAVTNAVLTLPPTRPDPTRPKEEEDPSPPKPKHRDPSLPVAPLPGVHEVHEAWKLACGYPAHKFRGAYDSDAAILADAIAAYGLPDCLLVAAEAPNDGMVNGKRDEHGAKHDTIRYVFGNADAFARILRAAHDAAGKARGRRSMTDAVAEQKRL